MEDETVMGSCHFGLGANTAFGGALAGPFHSDLCLREPTISIGGTTIVRDGLFVDRNLA
jgi:leucyl aminopeptidase (aminopeptidase T)